MNFIKFLKKMFAVRNIKKFRRLASSLSPGGRRPALPPLPVGALPESWWPVPSSRSQWSAPSSSISPWTSTPHDPVSLPTPQDQAAPPTLQDPVQPGLLLLQDPAAARGPSGAPKITRSELKYPRSGGRASFPKIPRSALHLPRHQMYSLFLITLSLISLFC
jgi:hypothetical protein